MYSSLPKHKDPQGNYSRSVCFIARYKLAKEVRALARVANKSGAHYNSSVQMRCHSDQSSRNPLFLSSRDAYPPSESSCAARKSEIRMRERQREIHRDRTETGSSPPRSAEGASSSVMQFTGSRGGGGFNDELTSILGAGRLPEA